MFKSKKKLILLIASAAIGLTLAWSSSAQIWRSEVWASYAGNSQHTAMSTSLSASTMTKILWTTPVDLNPQYFGSELLTHYAPPMVDYAGNVLVTVKTGANGGFQVEGRNGLKGTLIFTQTTDYVLPSSGWTPTCGSCLSGLYGMVTPGIGGTIYFRNRTDLPTSNKAVSITQLAFYGISSYTANKSTYNANVFICTPLTVDNVGNTYFGFRVSGTTPTNLVSGIAKVTPTGKGSWISAADASGDSSIIEPEMNCAPALSNDERTLYISVSHGDQTGGYLVGIDTATMAKKFVTPLIDPRTGASASLFDISTATPMVGPDGDVYFGVLESTPLITDRGWMLHYDETLKTTKIPGSFGWDNTASVVPASCVAAYKGKSSYLILTKYNDYAGLPDGVAGFPNGNGENKVAILDPNASTPDPINGPSLTTGLPIKAMTQVISVLGPTPDQNNVQSFPNAVHEWCINSAAIDVRGKCAILNSEDGHCYRWDFTKNKLTQTQSLSGGLGEAYTSTTIGRSGVIYAINNAQLFAVGTP